MTPTSAGGEQQINKGYDLKQSFIYDRLLFQGINYDSMLKMIESIE